MKKKTLFGSILGGLLASASGASAITAPGAMCQPGINALVSYNAGAARHNGGIAGTLVCPVATGANLGTHVQWAIRVVDNNPSASIACVGYTYDSNGFVVATAATGNSANGASTLTAVTAFQTAPSHTQVAECSMPLMPFGGVGSEVQRVEAY